MRKKCCLALITFSMRGDFMNTKLLTSILQSSNDLITSEDFFPILERDWKASHTMFIGVQNYDLRREHPDIDPTVCLYFARLLADVGKYFERGNVEFAKEY